MISIIQEKILILNICYKLHELLVEKVEVTGIILAGGKSSRMGKDKGLMSLKGKMMIQYVIDVLRPMVSELIIISNNKKYEQFGYQVHEDIIKEMGPLAGLFTGLQYSKTKDNIVLSCDTPFVTNEILKLLSDSKKDNDVVIAENRGKIHPLIGVYSKACLKTFDKELREGRRKVLTALNKLKITIVNTDQFDSKNFLNLNSVEDLKTLV